MQHDSVRTYRSVSCPSIEDKRGAHESLKSMLDTGKDWQEEHSPHWRIDGTKESFSLQVVNRERDAFHAFFFVCAYKENDTRVGAKCAVSANNYFG